MNKIKEIFNFECVGEKIKNLAKWSCWIMVLLYFIAAPVALLIGLIDGWLTALSFLAIVVGVIVASIMTWVSSWFIYGYGEIIDKNSGANEQRAVKKQPQVNVDKNVKLEKMRAQGLITEEEYQAAIRK